MIEDAIGRVVFVAFTVLATGGAFLVGRHFRGWKLGCVVAALVCGGMAALAFALERLLAGQPAG